jgi:hypothetical protein
MNIVGIGGTGCPSGDKHKRHGNFHHEKANAPLKGPQIITTFPII